MHKNYLKIKMGNIFNNFWVLFKDAYVNLSIDNWKINSQSNFEEIWNRFLMMRKNWYVFARMMFVLASLIYTVVLTAIYFELPFIIDCYRSIGNAIYGLSLIRGNTNFLYTVNITLIAGFMYFFLIFVIANSVHLSSHFIKLLANHEIHWPEELVKSYQNKYSLPDKKVIGCRILLDFIKQHTDASNTFIYYPFFLLFLIILSRNYYFDHWQTTPLSLLLYTILIILTLTNAFRLRAAAQWARERILDKLESNLPDAPVNQPWHMEGDNAAKLKTLIIEIREFKEGIYKPLSHHPMVLYLLLPIGSLASIYLIGHWN